AMMKEVEAGNVEYLCIKDMSRMGRDYLKVGQIMEILRQRGVRLIAINDGVDSARGDDDFTPFRNIMNEYYARDTSRKIRSTFQSKGKSGKHLTGTVIYGYLWNEARDQWLVDPEAAEVVKRIFAMTIDGYGPYQIASKLKEEKVLIPSAYLARHGEGVNKNKTFKDVYGWGSSTICNILEKREYLGHTINFKTRKHFKDKKSHYVPEDEWTIFENTHEAIIDQQTFDLVQKIRGNVRRYPDGWGEAAPLTGLLYCADCGGKMYVHRTNNGKRRPGFLAMMKEVEAGNVEYLCIKDMSRMGRDYLKVGQIMEILRQRGVRLIAINDGVDSARGDDDFTPFRNIMNEYYARDTSRKIRSTFQSKGKSGKHLTGTVIYGYLWNEARDQWLVDPEAAEVVKRIFSMTIDGYGPYQIASKLKLEKVLIPSAYLAQHGEGVNKNKTFKDVYGWGSSTICNILEKREYLGHTINFKTRKHFKDKKSHYVPEDEWTIFENTHEPIIDQQTFDLVQKIRGNVRRYPDGWGEAAPLTGLLYCADCGGKMYVHRTNNGKRISQYTCSQYTKVPCGTICKTQHRINEDVILSLVSEMLKAIAEYAKHDRAEFVRVVQEAQSSQQTAEVRKQRTRLATAKQRVSELEVLLCKIYEDNILGKLSDSRYATLDAQYEKEQSELTAEISALEKAVKSYEKHEKDADRFIALIDKYENFDKLTIAMLNEFIEKILVHERDRKGSIQTTQEVEIYFNFVGRFVPPAFGEVELTPEELEEIRKREERKDRFHQNYLKRKASGAQKRYEDKIKGRKKAEIEAKKAAIRAEDIAKGVFVPVSSLPQREPMKGAQIA
ncbi:recombinase family protein, partial [Ruthenibacterium lactatiformans]|uniref:recombinase family protein n=1 Tax=Ruthenibacterium lactatiformans TaxID=1550024 RepID=UPI001FAA9D5C